jgi:hypothetical protein
MDPLRIAASALLPRPGRTGETWSWKTAAAAPTPGEPPGLDACARPTAHAGQSGARGGEGPGGADFAMPQNVRIGPRYRNPGGRLSHPPNVRPVAPVIWGPLSLRRYG